MLCARAERSYFRLVHVQQARWRQASRQQILQQKTCQRAGYGKEPIRLTVHRLIFIFSHVKGANEECS